jgi:hypothetical protein
MVWNKLIDRLCAKTYAFTEYLQQFALELAKRVKFTDFVKNRCKCRRASGPSVLRVIDI